MALVRLSPETGSLIVRTSFFFPGSVLIGVTIELGLACLAARGGEPPVAFAGDSSAGLGLLAGDGFVDRDLIGAGTELSAGFGLLAADGFKNGDFVAAGIELSAGFGLSGAFGIGLAFGLREGEGDFDGLGCTRGLESESTFLGLFGFRLGLRIWSESFFFGEGGEVDCLLPSRGAEIEFEAMGGKEGKEGIESPLGPDGAGGAGGAGIIEEKPGMSIAPLGNS